MRLKRNRLKPYLIRKAVIVTSDEGIKKATYSDVATKIRAEIWPASGRLQAEIYGERVNYILNCLIDRETLVEESDGFCIDSDKVTHKVISIKRYTNHQVLELEQCRS
ncbi:hypothetical protein [Streptococcus suis]|uniref:hypothetical protein n=1 Tax=Streptococcus suis TaxID=1307 RepID=UPI000516D737|nr:hypothetical protein [Streptococcus suis]